MKYIVKAKQGVDQTKEIQEMVDSISENSGGELIFEDGIFEVSSIKLCSNLDVHLSKDTIIRASKNISDYTDFNVSSTIGYAKNEYYIKLWNIPKHYIMGIFVAYEMENIKIIGQEGSIIDGQDCYDVEGEEGFRGPMGIVFSQCENIELSGYEFINSANWSHQLDSSKNISIRNVKVTAGHDGFNFHHCSDIVVENCDLKTGDDCIAGYDIENLMVKGCKLNTACNTIRVGGADIIIENCHIYGLGLYPHLSKNTFYTHSIMKYYSMEEERNRHEGNIVFRNCKIEELDKLIAYEYGRKDKLQDGKPLKKLKFEKCEIMKLRDTTIIRGNGQQLTIDFLDTKIENINAYKHPLFDIDEYVKINANNTKFIGNKEIKIYKGEK